MTIIRAVIPPSHDTTVEQQTWIQTNGPCTLVMVLTIKGAIKANRPVRTLCQPHFQHKRYSSQTAGKPQGRNDQDAEKSTQKHSGAFLIWT